MDIPHPGKGRYGCPDAAAAMREFPFDEIGPKPRALPPTSALDRPAARDLQRRRAQRCGHHVHDGNPVIGTIAASIYMLDLAVVGPILLRRASREEVPRR